VRASGMPEAGREAQKINVDGALDADTDMTVEKKWGNNARAPNVLVAGHKGCHDLPALKSRPISKTEGSPYQSARAQKHKFPGLVGGVLERMPSRKNRQGYVLRTCGELSGDSLWTRGQEVNTGWVLSCLEGNSQKSPEPERGGPRPWEWSCNTRG